MKRGASIRKQIAAWCSCGLVVVAALLGAAACGGESGTESSPSAQADVLRVVGAQSPTTWDPAAAYSDEVAYVANCYETLVYANPPGSAEPFTPKLATAWQVSDDGLTWTFDLREGVTFHDGTPFNAQAVKYSFDRTKELNLGGAYLLWAVEKVKVVSEYQVQFILSTPVALDRVVAAESAGYIYSPATEAQKADWWEAPNEAGTGPWVLDSYTPNEEVVFSRYADYWGGWQDNQFRKVVVKIVSDSTTSRQMLEAGDVDVQWGTAPDDIPALQSNPSLEVYAEPSFYSFVMFFNAQREPLSDVKVRQALSYAVPYADLIAIGANGMGTQARGPVPAGLWPHDDALPQYTTDLEKAKSLLAEAGYPDGGFKLTLTYSSENFQEAKWAPLIKEAFAKVGVDVTVQGMLWNQQWAKAKGPAGKRQDMTCLMWWPSYPNGLDELYGMFHTEEEPFFNLAYWSSPEYDELLFKANGLEATDAAKSFELYSQAQSILVDEAPAAYLYDSYALSAWLKTVTLDSAAANPNYPSVLFYSGVTTL